MFYLPEFSGFFIIILPCSEKVFVTKLKAVLLLALVRHKSIICQNPVFLIIKLDVPCGVIFII